MIVLKISNASELIASRVGEFVEKLTPDFFDDATVEDLVIKRMIENLANEGINGTICGPNKGVEGIYQKLSSILNDSLEIKFSFTTKQAFRRFKARRKCEIVTMGVEGINPNQSGGIYIKPDDWNAYINDPGTLVIDPSTEIFP